MKSFTTLQNLFTTLSQNTSTANTSLAGQLINDQHRYLIQKYFDNERTYTTVTIGAATLASTGAFAIGDTTGTLSASWTSATCQQLVVFSSGEQRTITFTQNSTSISWQTGLTKVATTVLKTVGVQAYPIPANVSKIKNDTITIGQLQYTPAPIQTVQEWSLINALPYTSDIPLYYFIYQNQVQFWPIPSTSGNVITFNYKTRIADLTSADYTTGTINTATVGSNLITGTITAWTVYPQNTDLSFMNLMLNITPPNGDGLWYPIQRFTSATALTLNLPIVNAPNSSGANYTIGQFPLLEEDFHDMLVYGALMVYFNSIQKDADKFKLYELLYNNKLQLLEDYAGTKSVNVDLGAQPLPRNPNLFYWGNGSST